MLAKIIALLALSASAALAGSTAKDLIERDGPPDVKSLLAKPDNKWCKGTQVFFPGMKNYASLTTQRWTTYEAPSYVAAVKPACPEDVQKIVKLCSRFNIPFLATGGGHGYSTSFGKLKNGLSIDLGAFKQVKVDKAASTMAVGGAVTFGEVYEPLYNAGKEIQTGSCTCVGMLGGTLGGGVGPYQGIHGLIADSVLSFDMVTAAGDRITVSKDKNPDLFWGMRGAGMNYGIVLEATYEVYDLTNGGKVQIADFIFNKAQKDTFFKTLASLSGKLPPEFSTLSYIDYNVTYGGTAALIDITYPGPKDKFIELIKPFTDIKPAYSEIQNDVPWRDYLLKRGFGLVIPVCAKGQQHSLYSVAAKELSAADYSYAFDQYDKLYNDFPEARLSTLELEFFPNQGVVAKGDDFNAYPWRDVQMQIMIQMSWTGAADSPAANAANKLAKELRPRFIKSSGYKDLEVYVSYAHGDEKPENWYGASKLPKLKELKKKWDPKDLFKWDNGVPMGY